MYLLNGIGQGAANLALVAGFFAAFEGAYRLGRHHSEQRNRERDMHTRGLQGALLLLVALLHGFYFAATASRFENRQSILQEEVDTLRTVYLLAQTLAPPQRQHVTRVLRNYVDARVEEITSPSSSAQQAFSRARAAEGNAEAELWEAAGAIAVESRGAQERVLAIEALGKLFSVNERRRATYQQDATGGSIKLLIALTLGVCAFLAYGQGLAARRRLGSSALAAMLIGTVIIGLLAFDRAFEGTGAVQQRMIALERSWH